MLAGLNQIYGFAAVSGRGNNEITGLQEFTECQPQVTVVVDNEDAGFTREHFAEATHSGVIGKFLENFRFKGYNWSLF
jgi:hypothetical protein